MTRRSFLRLGCAAILGTVATGGTGAAYAFRVEPAWVEVTHVSLPLTGWPVSPTLRIAQLSDLHVGKYVEAARIRSAVEITNRLQPDLVLLTGDFVYGLSVECGPDCTRELAALRARHGVYAVIGNHDVWTDVADMIARDLRKSGIEVLRNERRRLEIEGGRLWLLGIEDTGYTGFPGTPFTEFVAAWRGRASALQDLLEGIPEAEPRLLLAHNPDFAEMLPPGRIDLVLCGHTHGGQVRLPFLGAPILPSCFGQRYGGGLVQRDALRVYVNRGIGLTPPPIRFNCRPEVTMFSLRGV